MDNIDPRALAHPDHRRITGSAFRLGGLALAVSPRRRAAGIPRQRSGPYLRLDRRTGTV